MGKWARLSGVEREPGEPENQDRIFDLFWGIGPSHIRRLCESTFEGGYGYDPIRVGQFTLDQIFFLLCDKDVLRGSGKKRIQSFSTNAALSELKETPDGKYAGISRTGKKITAEFKGKSKARRLMEEMKNKEVEENERLAREEFKQRRRRRNRG